MKFKLLSEIGSNPKLAKQTDRGAEWFPVILHLAPHKLSGHNVCSEARECIAGCLNTAGRGRMSSVQIARIRKTKLFFDNRELFLQLLFDDIFKAESIAEKLSKNLCLRLNGTSDIHWETVCPELFKTFLDIQFYDYTKVRKRYRDYLDGKLPRNYHLTFSRQLSNHTECINYVREGGSAAVVFRSKDIPAEYLGLPVFNGDMDDLRFLDPVGHWIGLYAKGSAKHDASGFVVDA